MALPVLPNSSNFLAVALVINRPRAGPKLVFHYPPHVLPAQGRGAGQKGDEDELEDEDDSILERLTRPAGPSVNPAGLLQWNQDDHLFTESGSQIVPWEHVAGFPEKDLESILTPARDYHKRLFQVSLEPLVCVSYPIHVPENGVWKRKKKNAKREEKAKGGKKEDDDVAQTDVEPHGQEEESKLTEADHVEVKDMAAVPANKEDEAEEKKSSMTMFNLVFILKPQKHEVKDLVDIMFVNIIKKVNKAYKYCQQRGDFVWKESKKIDALKDKGREEKRKMTSLWNEILASSSLAASMQDIYDAVSQNKIAVLQLDTAEGTVTHSVQIPVPFHVPDIPYEHDTDAQGLWLTTANAFLDVDEDVDEAGYLDKNFALLLKEDEKKILSELQADPDETTLSMIEFVRHCKPTLSFHQVGQQSNNILTPAQVRKFAQHFIFWRRAIAIPPLHARDIYILSPNCDLSRLPQAAARWARQFPLAPALPNFLADLSVAPRPYKIHCPSKAHRPLYMTMLAWLMRGGWVTQLCTFAYVVVWPEIIYEVEYAIEAENIAKARRAETQGGEPSSLDSTNTTAFSSSNTTTTGGEEAADSSASPTASSRHPSLGYETDTPTGLGLTILTSLSSSSDHLAASTATVRNLTLSPTPTTTTTSTSNPQSASPTPTPTSIDVLHPQTSSSTSHNPSRTPSSLLPSSPPHSHPHHHHTPTPAEAAAEKARLERLASRAARDLADKATAHARKAPPKATRHPSVNDAAHLVGLSPHVILDAKKTSGKESLYLDAIGRRLLGGGGGEDTREGDEIEDGGKGREKEKGKEKIETNGRGGRQVPGSTTTKQGGVATGTGTGAGAVGGKDVAPGGGKDWDERVAAAWPVFWKYFNGRCALERIALQEDMKRKDAWNLLTGMSEYLLTVRHW
ncbi:nitrogen permease regulator of amino acid transport activity 3-domain-containing protein [Coniochaeta sp. 2T2.1]|nr:nitrogen permease regulator of amino acid transport activity 3-domain-containing protein [Coniochaeta sp. 2T2.1]